VRRWNDRDNDVRRQIGHDAVMAANALAEFAARAEPVDRIVFDEAAEFDRGFDVAEAIQFGIAAGFRDETNLPAGRHEGRRSRSGRCLRCRGAHETARGAGTTNGRKSGPG